MSNFLAAVLVIAGSVWSVAQTITGDVAIQLPVLLAIGGVMMFLYRKLSQTATKKDVSVLKAGQAVTLDVLEDLAESRPDLSEEKKACIRKKARAQRNKLIGDAAE